MQISLPIASFLSENPIIFTHVDEARKANLHVYKRVTIRPAIYERGLCLTTQRNSQNINYPQDNANDHGLLG